MSHLAAAVSLVAGGSTASGAIQAYSAQAYLRTPDLPGVLGQGVEPFSFFMRLRLSGPVFQDAHLLHVPGTFEVFVDASSQTLGARLFDASEQSLELALALTDGTGQIPSNEWILIAVSWDGAAGALDGWAGSQSVATVTDAAMSPGFVPAPPQGDLSIGKPDAGGTAALIGVYGLIVFRDHAVGAADIDDIWDSHDYFAPYRLDNTATGGLLTGEPGGVWMSNHAIMTNPLEAVIGQTASAALPGGAVLDDNYNIFTTAIPSSTHYTAGHVSAVSSGGASFVYISPYDTAAQPFFERQVPTIPNLPEVPYVVAAAPKMRQLALGTPQQLTRVVISANSHVTQARDADEQTWAENFVHGFIAARLPQVAGIMNRPALLNANVRWFGFDTDNAPRNSGQISPLSNLNAKRNFARVWTNSVSLLVGPGAGIHMSDGAIYALKCRPESGSLLVAEAPLVVRTHLLRFTGAGTVAWQPVKATAQQLPGTTSPGGSLDLATTATLSYTMTSEDVFNLPLLTIVVTGDVTADVQVGDGCYVSDGPGTGGFTVVTGVSSDGQTTDISFEHWFANQQPSIGSTLQFGPWELVSIEYEWPPLEASDPEVWRGLELTALGGPVINYGWDAWRPDVDGFVFGGAGWGGNGYTPQIDESFAAAIPSWMQIFDPDVWLEAFANQDSAPESMMDYLNQVRAALPDVEVAWLGEGEHANSSFDQWHQFILGEAEAAGVVAASTVLDKSIGTVLDQTVDGLRADTQHWSHRANTRLAGRWLEQFQQAALPSPDIDGDGEVGINDFLILLGTWGPCPPQPEPCPADLDGDGEVGINDFLILLGNWG